MRSHLVVGEEHAAGGGGDGGARRGAPHLGREDGARPDGLRQDERLTKHTRMARAVVEIFPSVASWNSASISRLEPGRIASILMGIAQS
eukprot:406191-Pleurochrysis_carterae.AAC.1